MPRASPAARVRKPTGTRAANQRPGGSVEREPPPRAASDVRRRSLWRIRRSVSCTVAGGVLPARLLCGHFRLGFQRRAPVSSALPAARCERALSFRLCRLARARIYGGEAWRGLGRRLYGRMDAASAAAAAAAPACRSGLWPVAGCRSRFPVRRVCRPGGRPGAATPQLGKAATA